jgi:hypothetical protein
MPFNYLKAAFVGLIMTTSGFTSAAIITVGNLTLENAGDIYVTDTVNNVDYMRWDQNFNLTLAEITAATLEAGNALQGWSVATSLQANNFTDALLGVGYGNLCSGFLSSTCEADVLLATEIRELLGYNYSLLNSYQMFVNDIGSSDVGIMYNFEYGFGKDEVWDNVETGDFWSTNTSTIGDDWFTYQLYRPSQSASFDVSAPSVIVIFVLGLMGIASRRLMK